MDEAQKETFTKPWQQFCGGVAIKIWNSMKDLLLYLNLQKIIETESLQFYVTIQERAALNILNTNSSFNSATPRMLSLLELLSTRWSQIHTIGSAPVNKQINIS